MADRYIRISALFERTDLVHIDGHWCLPMAGLGEVLAQGGLSIVETSVPGSHGAQRDAVTACDLAHETAPGGSSRYRYVASKRCGCATDDDCLRRGCGVQKTCGCATLDDCLRRGC